MTKETVTHILKNDNKLLQPLFSRLHELKQWNALFASYVDAALAAHCHIVNIQNNCLIVITDSSNWLTQLRFQIPDILPKLRNHPELQHIQAICGKTRPDYQPVTQKRKRRAKRISQRTAEMILKETQAIKDEKLQAVMQKIAERK